MEITADFARKIAGKCGSCGQQLDQWDTTLFVMHPRFVNSGGTQEEWDMLKNVEPRGEKPLIEYFDSDVYIGEALSLGELQEVIQGRGKK